MPPESLDSQEVSEISTVSEIISPNEQPYPPAPQEQIYQPFLVQDILPVHVPHIIGGLSGSAKSLLTLQLAHAIRTGTPFLNYPTYKHTVRYVTTYDNASEYQETAEKMGLDIGEVFYHPKREQTIRDIVDSLCSGSRNGNEPDAEVLIIESIARLMPTMNINFYREVSNFMNDLKSTCRERKITIIGTHLCSKSKHGPLATNPKGRLMGSGAFAEGAKTTIIIDHINEEDIEDPNRRIQICCSSNKSVVFEVEITPNMTFEIVERLPNGKDSRTELERRLRRMKAGETFTIQDIMEWFSLSQATAYRRIVRAEGEGIIRKAAKGVWEKAYIS